MSAQFSVSRGNRAVLTAWGGHNDLKKRFPDFVALTPVYRSESGPFISMDGLAQTLAKTLKTEPSAKKTDTGKFVETEAAQTLAKIVLNQGRLQGLVSGRRYGAGRPEKTKYLCRPLRPSSTIKIARKNIFLSPWVVVKPKSIFIDDPRRGRIVRPDGAGKKQIGVVSPSGSRLKITLSSARWLVRNGFGHV